MLKDLNNKKPLEYPAWLQVVRDFGGIVLSIIWITSMLFLLK
jgi:hypothetical protein